MGEEAGVVYALHEFMLVSELYGRECCVFFGYRYIYPADLQVHRIKQLSLRARRLVFNNSNKLYLHRSYYIHCESHFPCPCSCSSSCNPFFLHSLRR
jgi:hypothetical protein